jgi:hypothetical protein
MKNAVFWDINIQFVLHRRHITSPLQSRASYCYVRFEVFTAVTMKYGVFWNVTPCGSCKSPTIRRNVEPPKYRFLQEPHGLKFQKIPFCSILVHLETSGMKWMNKDDPIHSLRTRSDDPPSFCPVGTETRFPRW